MKKLLFILPLLYYSCTDDIVADIDALQTENAEQDAQIDSLLNILTIQQQYIDSMNSIQNTYVDSLISESMISDSLLQVYTDSLHNSQQTTLETLANSALNIGFIDTVVISNQYFDCAFLDDKFLCNTIWWDMHFQGIIGIQPSIVLLKVKATYDGISSDVRHFWRAEGIDDSEYVNSWDDYTDISSASISNSNEETYVLVKTNETGLLEMKAMYSQNILPKFTISIVFYLNQ